MIAIGTLLILLYATTLLWLLMGFFRNTSEKEQPQTNAVSSTNFSIIIPFRNEAENLSALLKSIDELNYPTELFEIILVNDASEDTSKSLVTVFIKEHPSLHISCIENERISASPKKDAITKAINISKFEWIITTDADCIVPKEWLSSLDHYIQKSDYGFIAGPVALKSGKGLLYHFQNLDVLSLQLVTMGSFGWQKPMFCNGANLAYKKELFRAVNGFENNTNIASGDDVFLLDAIRSNFPEQVGYLKDGKAVVFTNAQKNWKSLIEQHIRWTSKTSKQENENSKDVGWIVFLANTWIVIASIYLLFDASNIVSFLILFSIKWILDLILLFISAHFFKRRITSLYLFVGMLLYPFFTLMVIFRSLSGNYSWKGRNYRKQR